MKRDDRRAGARGRGRRRVVAPAAPGRGDLHADPDHRQGPEDRRRHASRSWRPAPISPRPGRTSSRSSCAPPGTARTGRRVVTRAFLYLTACSLKNRVLDAAAPPARAALPGRAWSWAWRTSTAFVVRNQMRAARRGAAGLAAARAVRARHRGRRRGAAVGRARRWPGSGRSPRRPWTFTAPRCSSSSRRPSRGGGCSTTSCCGRSSACCSASLIAALFSGAARAAAAGRWSFVLGGWLLFATIHLHVLGAILTKAEFPGAGDRRCRGWRGRRRPS